MRRAFTLMELLITITVVALLAALTVTLFPHNFRENHRLNLGADLLTQWLLQARGQAVRDGVSTGLRLGVQGGVCRVFHLVKRQDDFCQGMYVGSWDETATGNAVAWFRLPYDENGVERQLDSPRFGNVQSGDYLDLNGTLRRIESATHYSLTLARGTTPLPGPTLPDANRTGTEEFRDGNNGRNNYRIIRGMALVPGYAGDVLPEGIILDVNLSLGVEETAGHRDVVFSPQYHLEHGVGEERDVVLWLRQDRPGASGTGILVHVNRRTGEVSQHPVATGSDPYQFTRDGRSSGM